MRTDRPDNGTEQPDAPAPRATRDVTFRAEPPSPPSPEKRETRVARSTEYRATVDEVNRAHAIDQGYARVREIEEKTVTPAMRRIEAQDPERHLAGLEHRLKGKERLTEKVTRTVNERGHSVTEAFALLKDAIRYTFCYPEEKYANGVEADCLRIQQSGFERVDRENSWAKEQYKGINSRWRTPGSGQVFEVQFHTPASLEAKEITHPAYEKLRVGTPSPIEQRNLENFQKEITARVPVPKGAMDISDYH